MGKWVKKKLGEVIIDSYAGGTPNRNREDFFGGEIPWVTSGEVNNPEIISTMENITEAGIKGSSAKWIPENSILVALYGATAGQVSMLKIKATSNQAVLAIIPNNEIIDTDFLHNQICFNKQNLLFLAQGSGQPNLSKNIVDRLPISYPSSLSEQRRIASILSSADKVIDSTQKLIAKYKQIKQGMMEDLLKPKEGWKKVKLGECCEINPKTDTSKVLDDDIIVFVKMEDVSNDGFITSFNEKTYQSLQKKGFTVFQNDDVIFAKITPCMENGKGALVRDFDTKICMGSTEFHVIRACENISIDFIYQLTISKQFRLKAEMQMTGSAGQQRVPISFLEDYLFYIPDLSEQCRIASILSGIDKKIESEEKVLEKYKKIKKGLMEKLLNCE